jgi:hypothetical protein
MPWGLRRNKWGDDTPQKEHGKGLSPPALFLRKLAVVGVKAWTKAWDAELARAKSMVGCWGKKGAGYEQR